MVASSLPDGPRDLLRDARRAVLATQSADGTPRLVPVCFVVADDGEDLVVYTPIDEKPKTRARPRDLARVRDILARPRVALLLDHWSEDWTELMWVRLAGSAALLDRGEGRPGERDRAIAALRSKYPQYAEHDLQELPIIRVAVDHATSWAWDAGG